MIIKRLLDREYLALLGSGLYAMNPVILGNVLFIRMYVLLSTFVLILILLFTKENVGGGK